MKISKSFTTNGFILLVLIFIANINVPYFRHINIFFGLLKNGGIFSGGNFSNLTFWAFFDQK